MRKVLRLTQKQYNALSKNLKAGHPGKSAKLERRPRAKRVGKDKAQKVNPVRCEVHVVNFRRRLLDKDNLCAKFHVDALRYAGVLIDDSEKYIDLHVSQEKITEGQERTEITICPL